MAQKIDILQNSFAAGELTEAVQSREDLAKQHIGAKTLRNGIVTSIGSFKNRGGLRKVAEVNDSSVIHRLIPFTHSRAQAYATVWGENLSIVKDGVLILRDLVASAYKWTLSADGTSNYYLEPVPGGDPGLVEPLRMLEDGSTTAMTAGILGSLNASEFAYGDSAGDSLGFDTVYARTADSVDPDTKTDGYFQIVFMINTPANSGQSRDTDYAQSADVMYLTNQLFYPYKLTRTSDTDWALAKVPIKNGPWKAFRDDDDDVTMTPSAKAGAGVTITASGTYPFDGNWGGVNDQILLGYENPLDSSQIDWFYATVTGVGTSTTRIVTINEDLGFEYLLNPEFKDGLSFYENRSTGVSDTSYDAVNNVAELNQGASGNAYLTQEVSVNKYEKLTIEVVVDTIGGGGTLRLSVGNTALAADVLAIKSIVAAGTYSYSTLIAQPTGSTVHVTLATFAGTPDYTHEVSRVSVMREDLSTKHWRISAWSSAQGYPMHITALEQRFYYAGNFLEQPDTIWATRIGEYENFGFHSPPLDTDAVTITLASSQVNDIESITPYGELVVCTSQEEWRVSPGPTNDTITPTSISAKVKSSAGSTSVKPIIAGKTLLFLNRTANKIFALQYSLDSDAFNPVDLTILAPHLFEGYTITEWAYAKDPDSVVWCLRSDGKVIGLTYIEEQQIVAFHLHDTDGLFESVCVVPETGSDTVYFMVNRTIGGATKRFIEKLMPRITDEDIYDWYQVDSGVTVNSPITITGITQANPGVVTATGHNLSDDDLVRIVKVVGMTEVNNTVFKVANKTANDFELTDRSTGANIDTTAYTTYTTGGQVRLMVSTVSVPHLEGKTVVGIGDGSYIPETVVASGIITLAAPASLLHVGLPITYDLKTMPHDFQSGNGSTSQGRDKSVIKANVYFNKTGYAEIGTSAEGTLFEMEELLDNVNGDAPPSLQTGVFEQPIEDENGFSKLTHTFIRCDRPFPIEVMGIISEVSLSNG